MTDEAQARFDAFMDRMAATAIAGPRLANWRERVEARALRDRELHHFETEQVLAAIAALHSPIEPGPVSFRECRECHTSWPCATARLIPADVAT